MIDDLFDVEGVTVFIVFVNNNFSSDLLIFNMMLTDA